ncbi:hypothetical protein [Sinimarinibacterium flocculans]|uniref:hypothetical protein n=1 Tax=Sinimarinibacterium flocculans TaxID=985250 RepID=UPI0035113CC4
MIDTSIAVIAAAAIKATGDVLSAWIQRGGRQEQKPVSGEQEVRNVPPDVIRLRDLRLGDVRRFLAERSIVLRQVSDGDDIPGSYWGAPEAGLIGNNLYARRDTPIHSILHTACHWLCMNEERRAAAHTNAGGDDVEEVAVCYLQCLLADELPGYSRRQAFVDMDLWEYSFRLGSAKAWFEADAEDAQAWLVERDLVALDEHGIICSTAGRRPLAARLRA